jgi:hypothetical protein
MKPRFPYLKSAPASHSALSLIAIFVGSTFAVAQMPVAHWTFDDGLNNYDTTTVVDIVNGNNAVWQNVDAEMNFITSGLSYTSGQIGGAVRLGGGTGNSFLVDSVAQIDGIVATPDFGGGDPVLGVGVTWSAWINVNPANNSSNQGIFVTRTATDEALAGQGVNQNWGMNWESGDHIDSRVSGQPVDSPASSIAKGQWYHLVLVWGNVDGAASFIPPAQRLYVNGVLAGEDADSEVFEMVSSGSWQIGNDSGGAGRQFQGLLDDFAIFDSALSTAQVQALYNNGLSGINASGIATDEVPLGDVDGSGVVDTTDFGIIRDNIGKTVAASNLGDLDGNRRVDLNDYQHWLDIVHPAMAAAALQGFGVVPEPSGMLLAALATVAGCCGRCAGRSLRYRYQR